MFFCPGPYLHKGHRRGPTLNSLSYLLWVSSPGFWSCKAVRKEYWGIWGHLGCWERVRGKSQQVKRKSGVRAVHSQNASGPFCRGQATGTPFPAVFALARSADAPGCARPLACWTCFSLLFLSFTHSSSSCSHLPWGVRPLGGF